MNPKLSPEIDEALRGRWEPVYRSQLHYLVTWSTRGRRPVLRDRHVRALRDLVQRSCDESDYRLIDLAAGHDHVHVLIGLSPTHSIASVVRQLKEGSGVELLRMFPELRVWLRAHLVWDEPYSVETVSATRIEKMSTRLRALHPQEDELAAAC